MPPKIKKKAAGGNFKAGSKSSSLKKDDSKIPQDESSNPKQLLLTYSQICKSIGLDVNEGIKKSLTTPPCNPDPKKKKKSAGVQAPNPHIGVQIIINGNEHPIGSGGCRALAAALLGQSQDILGYSDHIQKNLSCEKSSCHRISIITERKSVTYNALKELYIWKCSIGEEGMKAVADILKLGGQKLQLNYLELLNTDINTKGTTTLGRALSCGANSSLKSLILDFSFNLDNKGISALCRGLRTNATLKKLSLKHCNIVGEGGGIPLGDMLSFGQLTLSELDLSGNPLGYSGLSSLCKHGLSSNQSLQKLLLRDIQLQSGVGAEKQDDNNVVATALKAFAIVICTHRKLHHIDLLYNDSKCFGASTFGVAKVLIDALASNKVISMFLVDVAIPDDIFNQLNRNNNLKESKKKKKKKKKKKATVNKPC